MPIYFILFYFRLLMLEFISYDFLSYIIYIMIDGTKIEFYRFSVLILFFFKKKKL